MTRFIFDLIVLGLLVATPITQVIILRRQRATERTARRVQRMLSVWADHADSPLKEELSTVTQEATDARH